MENTTLVDIKDASVRSLCETSALARSKAYIPYSKFAVGAALLATSGQVVTGCNVENVSFGLTICAERTAIVKAVSEGVTTFSAIAVSAVSKNEFIVSPCGACRQVLAEFNAKLPVYLYNPENGKVCITSMAVLLPDAVLPENLNDALFAN